MEQAAVGHRTDIAPKASCGIQLTRTSGAEPKRRRVFWETREVGNSDFGNAERDVKREDPR